MNERALIEQAQNVLRLNDLGAWTRPTAKLYPHQWLWDSAFIAIGLRHINVQRAKEEIRSLFKGQWKNGMIPYIIFGEAKEYHAGPSLWKSDLSPNCPEDIQSTGGTQPPMIAEAIVRIGRSLPENERLAWYGETYPKLAAYHEWLYRERDPEGSGLVLLYHPWETGLDNNPAWMSMIHKHAMTPSLKLMEMSPDLTTFMTRFRRDTSVVPAEQRMSTVELMAFYSLVRQMRHLNYDSKRLADESKLAIQDIGMNSILVRATQHLSEIAKTIGETLPPLTEKAHKRGVSVLEELWDEETGYYYSKDFRTGALIPIPTVASFLPLYAGNIYRRRIERLKKHLQNPEEFATKYPIPSVPVNSPTFKPHCYWQGPTWINLNWLISLGLSDNGYESEAKTIQKSSLELIAKSGMYEYYSPLDGAPAGAPEFSWTAALTLEMLKNKLK